MTRERVEELIRECQSEAERSIKGGNPPFGCVITDVKGKVVARAHNTQNTDSDPTAHAEIRALRLLGKRLGTRYFNGYIMFTNCSGCPMCVVAALSHITDYYYGAPPEPHMDPWLPVESIVSKSKKPFTIHGPILEDACAAQIARGRATQFNAMI
jgi:tRNA(adenine34) deaminase